MLLELEGYWNIERQITGSCEANFSGYGLFTYQGSNVLNYREEGSLSLNGSFYDCERSYVFRQLAPLCLAIYFPDGREFLRLDFGDDLRSCGTHVCGRDIYQASYHFLEAETLETRIAVVGPNKDYLISSLLQKKSVKAAVGKVISCQTFATILNLSPTNAKLRWSMNVLS